MRTIEEIKKLKDENRRKWGKDLIAYLKSFFDEGRTYFEIIEMLKTHGIEINKSELGNLKYRYYNIIGNQQNTKKEGYESKEIEQKKESEKSEIEKAFEEIFGEENIIEKQKREKEKLYKNNIRGAKW